MERYLNLGPRKLRFPLNLTDRQTDGHLLLQSSLATKNNLVKLHNLVLINCGTLLSFCVLKFYDYCVKGGRVEAVVIGTCLYVGAAAFINKRVTKFSFNTTRVKNQVLMEHNVFLCIFTVAFLLFLAPSGGYSPAANCQPATSNSSLDPI